MRSRINSKVVGWKRMADGTRISTTFRWWLLDRINGRQL